MLAEGFWPGTRIQDMNPTALFRHARLLLIPLLALPGAILQAQEETPTPKASRPARSDPEAITIDFPGGPLSKLAAKLNETGDPKLSIVQSPGLDPMLPAFSVRNVRVSAIIAALGRILEAQGFALNPVDHNLAVLSKIEHPKIEHPQPTNHFASLQLGRKIDPSAGWTAEEIIAAIQQGTEFANPAGRSSTLRFKYHPGTNLLFVAGTSQEVDIAHRVFGSLSDMAPAKSQPTPTPEKK